MNIGYIYKITNTVNNKCYIGQTSKTIEERWRGHINASKRKDRSERNYPLYKAFRKYGIENFTIEELERCEINELNDREIYWISFYNSYKDGYNQDLGGGGKHTLELNEDNVIGKYNELHTVSKVAQYFNCSTASIRYILNKHDVEIKSFQTHAIERGIVIYQLDDNMRIVNTYNTLIDAGRTIYDLGLSNTKRDDTFKVLQHALLSGSKTYGYYWSSPAYTEERKEKYKKKKRAMAREQYIKQKRMGIKRKSRKKTNSTKTKICPKCGGVMVYNAQICIDCYNAERSVANRGITREFLKNEIRTKPFTTIAAEHGVSDNSVRKWCKKYNLPFRATDIKKLSDEEWELI